MAATQLRTGILSARAAPRTMPKASDPPMPIAATYNVACTPVQKSGMCSQMKCQSKLATKVIGGWHRSGRGQTAAPNALPHGQMLATSLPTGYAKVFFGRGTLSRKPGTSRAGAFAFRIFTNSSFFFM
jgi:hypothetical protein